MMILKISGISIDDFASYLGINAQTLRNLTLYENLITKMQFLSIMSLLEKERARGKNCKSVDTFLSSLQDIQTYSKYSPKFKEFYAENIAKKDRKLSKSNTATLLAATGIGAAIAAFGGAALLPMAGTIAGTSVSASLAGLLKTKEQKMEYSQMEIDIRNLENESEESTKPFSWLDKFYTVKDSIQFDAYYSNFEKDLKKIYEEEHEKSTKNNSKLDRNAIFMKKEALFDEKIDSLIKELTEESV